jgi:hypothetical protein
MYLRTTRQPRKHGPDVIYYQLAENYYHKVRRRSETRVIYNFGRADQVDPEALRRLAQSILRVANDERIDLAARKFPPEVGIDDIEQVYRYGVLYVAHALWEEVGIGPLLREKMQQDGCDAPHETALFTMTANRLARPASKLACDERWLADDVYWPAAQGLALEHLYRALDFLLRHIEALEQELFFRTADRFNADVDLIFWDTTTLYCEIDEEDDDGDVWEDQEIPALRKRGHNKEGRDGNPQVVVGLALTRDGLPVRSWVFPGNTADVTTIDNLRVKEVWVGEGERRRRYVVCHNLDEAAREHAHRKRLVELVRAELAALDVRQADHPKRACELMASRRFGRYLRMDTHGRLSLDTAKVAMAAKYDGKFVVTTNDDTLDAEDVALGYTSLTLIEGCFRQMKTTGLQTRPIYHWRPHRIIAHVKLCVLALLLQRAAEIRCQQTWRTIRHTLEQLKVVRYQMHGKIIVQSTQVTAPMAEILQRLGLPLPKKILEVYE